VTGRDLDARAVRVCERAYDAWFSWRGSSDFNIPLGTLASFMLADGINAPYMLKCPDADIVRGVREMWTWFWLRRPDLCNMAGPMGDWINDEDIPRDLERAIAQTARAAVNAGVGDLLGDDHLHDVDLLGHAHMALRPKSARDARGEFYTPPNVCYMMAQMILGDCTDLEPGMSIAEPAAGTGGMLRAAAQVLREHGKDPGDYWWVINDISALATAGLAVNAHVWGLGHRVIVGCADSLADPMWHVQAWEYQQNALARRDSLIRDASLLALLRSLERSTAIPSVAELAAETVTGPAPATIDVELPPDGTLFDAAELQAHGTLTDAPHLVTPARRKRRPSPDDDPDALALF
jgi:hypothetical protein